MILPLDGPSKSFILLIDDVTPVELKAGASVYTERKVLTIQGNGKFYVYFCDEGEIPSAMTVSSTGFIQFKNAKESYEASDTQSVYVLSFSGSVYIRGAERA